MLPGGFLLLRCLREAVAVAVVVAARRLLRVLVDALLLFLLFGIQRICEIAFLSLDAFSSFS